MRSDEHIKKDVIDELCWNSCVDASHIMVEVTDGIVVLSGTVPSYRARLQAGVSAASLVGVVEVTNQLAVDVTKCRTVLGDDVIQDNAAKALCWSPDLANANLSVLAKQGHVVVKGSVDAIWKKVLVDSLVSNIAGVRSIENLLAVVPTRGAGDIGTARDIVDALKRQLGADSENITVKIKDGVVTLMGTVPDWHVFDRARKAALFTFGVTHVDMRLTVKHATAKVASAGNQ